MGLHSPYLWENWCVELGFGAAFILAASNRGNDHCLTISDCVRAVFVSIVLELMQWRHCSPPISFPGIKMSPQGVIFQPWMGQHFLNPGAMYFARKGAMATLLGSCVSITIWFPETHWGGMCHYILPTRIGRNATFKHDGRYGDEAWAWMVRMAGKAGHEISDSVVGVFGGAQAFDRGDTRLPGVVGRRNIDLALQLLDEHRITPTHLDTGGTGSRKIRVCLDTGAITCRTAEAITLEPR